MRLLPAGERAVLVEVADTPSARALYEWAREGGWPVTDLVPAARTVLFDGVADLPALRAKLAAWEPSVVEPPVRSAVRLPTVYDGPDLAEVAGLWDMTRAEVIGTHSGTAFTVAFCGFAPGFAYCTGLPESLRVPRRSSPRNRVPTGAVGLADVFTGVYPRPSPGGWQLIGSTSRQVWDVDVDPPALLTPGTPVRFVEERR